MRGRQIIILLFWYYFLMLIIHLCFPKVTFSGVSFTVTSLFFKLREILPLVAFKFNVHVVSFIKVLLYIHFYTIRLTLEVGFCDVFTVFKSWMHS